MCKYCDETLYRFEHKRFVTKEEMYEPIDKNFCAHCGTPLGEVKPLTVEQLRDRVGKTIYCVNVNDGFAEWVKIVTVLPTGDITTAGGIRGYGYMGDYGETWNAFDREPKGEAE